MPTADGTTLIASNRRARRDYDILETVEAGLRLRGSEVKSLRMGQARLADAYVRFDGDEAWLQGIHIPPYSQAQGHSGHDPDRHRKLLLHRRQIDDLRTRVDLERLTVVPLSLYFKDGRVKVELALGRGRKTYDKREVIAKRDAAREAARELAHRNR